MPQVAVDGHDDIADAVGIVGVAAQLLVDDLKLFDGLLLMAKDLDNLLACHHLLDETVDLGQLLLLYAEVLARAFAQISRGPRHDQRHDDGKNGHGHTHHNHAGKGDAQRDERIEGLWQAVGNHLAQSVHIVGVGRHHVAMGMGVEVLDGQFLHVLEHILA